MDNRLLGQKEVAEMIGMSTYWMEAQRFKRTGIPFIKIGRAVRYRESQVREWIAEREVATR